MAFSDTLLTNPQVRSTLTQAAMRDRVRGDIGLRGQNFIADADINAWAIEAMNRIAKETRWYRTSRTMDATAGVAEYNFPSDTNGKWISLSEVHHGSSPLPLYLVTISELQVYNPYWRRTADGTPLFYYMLGNSGFGLHPTPAVTITNGIVLIGEANPPPPANDSDFYYAPYGGEEAIVTYCKLRAADKDIAGEGRFRIQELRSEWREQVEWIKRQVESAGEGDHCVMGGDAEGDTGVYRRVWGFDPNTPIAGAN